MHRGLETTDLHSTWQGGCMEYKHDGKLMILSRISESPDLPTEPVHPVEKQFKD